MKNSVCITTSNKINRINPFVNQLYPILLLSLLIIKSVFLLLDPNVRMFFGDSASYLHSAITTQAPPDRSFTYPLLILMTAIHSQSLFSLLLLQTGFGVATCMILFIILYAGLEVRTWLAIFASILLCIEPSQLFYERMVMTESASSFQLLSALACGTAYLRSGKVRWLLLCVAFGIALASLRVGLVPLSITLAPVTVLIGTLYGIVKRPQGWVLHLLLVLASTYLCHSAYRTWYGNKAGGNPSYILDAPLFRLGLVAPLIRPEHFADTGVNPAILQEVTIPLDNPRLREEQIWLPGGLISVLNTHAGERYRIVAAILAKRAVITNPVGVAQLGITTLSEYFDPPRREMRMISDLGDGQLPDEKTLNLLRESFHYDATKLARNHSMIKDFYGNSSYWLIVCLFALGPLSLVLVGLVPHRVPSVIMLITVSTLGLVIGQILCSHIISFRYLHPFPILVLLIGATLADRLFDLGKYPLHGITKFSRRKNKSSELVVK